MSSEAFTSYKHHPLLQDFSNSNIILTFMGRRFIYIKLFPPISNWFDLSLIQFKIGRIQFKITPIQLKIG